VSDEIDQELAEKLDEASQAGMSAISQIVQMLIDKYGDDLDVTLAQNQMLIALSTVTGELIACLPEEHRDFVEEKVKENISRQRMETEEDNGEIQTSEDDPHGLARMTPVGKC